LATLDTLKHEHDLRNTSQNQPFYGSIWQNKWQSYKMLATVMTGIAKILAAANKFAHLIARLKVQVKQILESIAIVFDTGLYVTPPYARPRASQRRFAALTNRSGRPPAAKGLVKSQAFCFCFIPSPGSTMETGTIVSSC